MDWTKVRGFGYLAALAVGSGVVALNLGTFDPASGMVDPHPFNLYLAIGAAGSLVGAPGLALLAVIRGWGKRT